VDVLGNVYFADTKNNAIKQWSPVTRNVRVLVSTGLNSPSGVGVDGEGNVYIADSTNNVFKRWNAVTQEVSALVTTGLRAPRGVAVGAMGNIYVGNTGGSDIKNLTLPYLSLGATSRSAGPLAGTDSVPVQLLPVNTPITATSDQAWLLITSSSSVAINFSFKTNTSVNSRIAHITVAGQRITVTQDGDIPASISKVAGTHQSTPVCQVFPTNLQVKVTDAAGNRVQGAGVTFTVVPGSKGASGTFSSSPAMPIITTSSGFAVAPVLTANCVAGTFTVNVTVGSSTAAYTLTIAH
jgi:hypothetical protein